MHEFWFDDIKQKYSGKAKLCYMDIGSFIVFIKTDDTYADIAEDFETRFDTTTYGVDRPLCKVENGKK